MIIEFINGISTRIFYKLFTNKEYDTMKFVAIKNESVG